ncbi:MAG: response regulator transcription factor [Gemmatimonadota bacterium]
MGTPVRTIIVDDEHLARRRLRTLLATHADFLVVAECEDGPEAVRQIRAHVPDLVFLDIKMVELDGMDVARAIGGPNAPLVTFVSAYDQYALEAFGVSAFDYLLKPFDEERFIATLDRVRIQVAKNRGQATPREGYRSGDIEVELSTRMVRRAGRSLTLRPKEFDLLVAFLKRPGIVISRRDLLEEVWGYQHDVTSRTIDTHLAELRRKLSPGADDGEVIETISRIGYRLTVS